MGDYYGKSTASIENEWLRIEYFTEIGPRIVGVYLKGIEENQLAEVPGFVVSSEYGDFHFWGGHRLWHAPEQLPRTYVPDDEGLTIENTNDAVRLVGKIEAQTGIRKVIEIQLVPGKREVHLKHTLINRGAWAIEFAPWAITQLPLGGEASMPILSARSDGLLPNRSLVFWPYDRMDDSRYKLLDEKVLISAREGDSPFKVGCMNMDGWISYTRKGVTFTKTMHPESHKTHPDMNCNAEIYLGNMFLELETLGPLTTVAPGECVNHEETWQWEW